jgi:peptide/nickel transport system substrate-binding protein
MKAIFSKLAVATVVGAGLALAAGGIANAAEMPKRGGILTYLNPSEIPSYDGHRETTFGVIHPLAPMYSLLIRVNPNNPQSPTDFVCDLCEGAVSKPTDGGKTFTFKIRKGVKFQSGAPLNAHDIVATYQKIIFPGEGVPSARKSYFRMVDSVTAPDDNTVVFKLKWPSGAFIPALATPFNWIYSKADLDKHGMNWHTKNVNGSGPFHFVQDQQGSFTEGKKNPNYHHMGLDGKPEPYLDGIKAIVATKLAVRVQAIRGDRAAIEFRGFPPAHRDELVKALGNDITVQESDWNCALFFTPNHARKPFDDARVRKAITLSLDRWGGSQYLSKIAIVKTVGGIVFPNHPLAATKQELVQLAGYGEDMSKNLAEAKRLLKEAGVEDVKIDFLNRGVDQPYKVVGTWAIDQWKKAGMNATQRVLPSPAFYDSLRKSHDFDVSIDFNCQSVINPVADITKFLGSSGSNHGQYKDQALEDIYQKIEKSGDEAEQRTLIRDFEKRAISDEAHLLVSLWWYKINPHRSYVKGWKIAPSHYLNQQLDTVWLDK